MGQRARWPTLISLLALCHAFNLDTNGPIWKKGPSESYFGYSVASHFSRSTPVILVGAPRGDNGQTDTKEAGALFSCPLSASRSDCRQVRAEYGDNSSYAFRPDLVPNSRAAYYRGKDKQLLGASVASQGRPNGKAVVCAPLMAFGNHSESAAYQYGACYVLSSQLDLEEMVVACQQEGLDTKGRHNAYTSCAQGHAAYFDDDFIGFGAAGSKNFLGGAFVRTQPKTSFENSISKYTMVAGALGEPKSAMEYLKPSSHLGFTIKLGRFGFAHENGMRQTVVSGAPRSELTGEVLFFPFEKGRDEKKLLMMYGDFTLKGDQLGASFGYAVEVVDINNDGYDDLIVSSPFERSENEEGLFTGAVRVYFSQGKDRGEEGSADVFHPPVIIRQGSFLSQFGLSIANLGNLDGDTDGYRDFAVGAPFDNDGQGAVYVFHGAKSPADLSKKPVQVITPKTLPSQPRPMRSFGFSLGGGVDVDGNHYPDLAVGAALSDTVAIFRARPVIKMEANHIVDNKYIAIDRKEGCPVKGKTCFKLTLEMQVEKTESTKLIHMDEDVFKCKLEVLEYKQGVARRAVIDKALTNYEHTWSCGKNAHLQKQKKDFTLFIPRDEPSGDWLNPLKLKFSVALQDEKKPSPVRDGQPLPNLQQFPMIDKFQSSHVFEVPFDTQCGSDNICRSDISIAGELPTLSRGSDGEYIMTTQQGDHVNVTFEVSNKKEKAYFANFWLQYDTESLDAPKLRDSRKLILEKHDDGLVQIKLGNPMNEENKYHFTLSFPLAQGRTNNTGKPLQFHAHVNSSSEEINPEDNEWSGTVRIIKKVQLEIKGISIPYTVYFGGDPRGQSDMELEEDIGPMVRHNYTIYNRGSWALKNIKVKFRWPYQVENGRKSGKWALYLLDIPTISTYHSDGSVAIKQCSVPGNVHDYVNPVQDIKGNTGFNTLAVAAIRGRGKRSPDEVPTEEKIAKAGLADWARKSASADRIQPQQREEDGMTVKVSTIGCPTGTAKCFEVICEIDYIDSNSSPIIDFRARLWNNTFREDYFDTEYVEIQSVGTIEIDESQGLHDDDLTDNRAVVTTKAYPDRPSIDETRPIAWWVIALSILIGLCIVLLIALCLWKCGFFKRSRPGVSLYRAELRKEQEEWGEAGYQ